MSVCKSDMQAWPLVAPLLFLSHARTRAGALSHTHAYTHTHRQTRMHPFTHSLTHIHIRARVPASPCFPILFQKVSFCCCFYFCVRFSFTFRHPPLSSVRARACTDSFSCSRSFALFWLVRRWLSPLACYSHFLAKNECTCMCVYVYAFMYTCTQVRVYVYMYVWMYVCMHVCMYVCMYVCLYVYMFVCVYVWMYVYMCACMWVYAYDCMFACIACLRLHVCLIVCMCSRCIHIHASKYVCLHAYLYDVRT